MQCYIETNLVFDTNSFIQVFNNNTLSSRESVDEDGFVNLKFFHISNINDELKSSFKIFRKEPSWLYFFQKRPHTVSILHKDIAVNGTPKKSGFNIPLLGCENSKMLWYQDHSIDEQLTQKTFYFSLKDDRYKKASKPIAELELIKPTIVRTDAWHGIDNSKNSSNRLMLCLAWDENYSMEEIQSFIKY